MTCERGYLAVAVIAFFVAALVFFLLLLSPKPLSDSETPRSDGDTEPVVEIEVPADAGEPSTEPRGLRPEQEPAKGPGLLKGRIKIPGGRSFLGGEEVGIFDSDGNLVGRAVTDNKGEYSVELPEGRYTVKVDFSDRGCGGRSEVEVDLRPGETAAADFETDGAPEKNYVMGIVRDRDTWAPVRDALITVTTPKNDPDGAVTTTTTGIDGRYRFPVSRAVSGFVVTHEDYLPFKYYVNPPGTGTMEYEVIRLRRKATISGRVYDEATGLPLVEAGLRVYGSSSGMFKTDETGRYSIDVAVGRVGIVCGVEGYLCFGYYPSEKYYIDVPVGGTTLDIALVPESSTIQIRVFDAATGKPIPERDPVTREFIASHNIYTGKEFPNYAVVAVYLAETYAGNDPVPRRDHFVPSLGLRLWGSQCGERWSRKLPHGTYRLTASCMGYKTAISPEIVVMPGEKAEYDFKLELLSTEAVSVRVVLIDSQSRQPVPFHKGTNIYVDRLTRFDEAGEEEIFAQELGDPSCLEDGSFEFGLYEGTYRIRTQLAQEYGREEEYLDTEERLVVKAGENVDLAIPHVKLTFSAYVRVKCMNEQGAPLEFRANNLWRGLEFTVRQHPEKEIGVNQYHVPAGEVTFLPHPGWNYTFEPIVVLVNEGGTADLTVMVRRR